MVVGVCQLVLSIPENNSLKGKRRVVRKILDRLRARYNVAAAEVDALDVHRRAVLGLSVVSNDRGHANSMLDDMTRFVANIGEALIVDRSFELIHVGDGAGEASW